MNDVLMAIWDNIQYYDPDKSSFQNWIAGIARYKSVDYLRRYLKDLNNQSWEEGMVKEEAGEQMELLEEELSEETESMLSKAQRSGVISTAFSGGTRYRYGKQ